LSYLTHTLYIIAALHENFFRKGAKYISAAVRDACRPGGWRVRVRLHIYFFIAAARAPFNKSDTIVLRIL